MEYRKLAGAAMLLLVAASRRVSGRTDRAELYYRLYDVLRELAYRGTTLACAVGAAGRRNGGDRASRFPLTYSTIDMPASLRCNPDRNMQEL